MAISHTTITTMLNVGFKLKPKAPRLVTSPTAYVNPIILNSRKVNVCGNLFPKSLTLVFGASRRTFVPSAINGDRFAPDGYRGDEYSATETIELLAAGAVAKKFLKINSGIKILAYVSRVHEVVLPDGLVDNETVTFDQIEDSIVRCPNPEYAQKMIDAIDDFRVNGFDFGGAVTCIIRNAPRRLCSSDFNEFRGELGKATSIVPGARAIEFRSGFDKQKQGGSSNGETIEMIIDFQPIYAFSEKEIELIARGRHDPWVVPRAVPFVNFDW